MDDPRRPLTPRNGVLYAAALLALEQQDEWTAEEHGAFWTMGLAVWPHPEGRPPHRDALSRSAALLKRDDLDPCLALDVASDTLRPRERNDRERPSVERGEELLRASEEESYGVCMRRSVGDLWEPERALPRVYALGEDEPDGGYFNPLVVVVQGAHRVAPMAELYDRRTQEGRRGRWEAARDDAGA